MDNGSDLFSSNIRIDYFSSIDCYIFIYTLK